MRPVTLMANSSTSGRMSSPNCWTASAPRSAIRRRIASITRSEEHTSELQSLAYLVCRLLLEKKKACNGPPQRQDDWRDELLNTVIRGTSGQRLAFSRVEPLPGTTLPHAVAYAPDVDAQPLVV